MRPMIGMLPRVWLVMWFHHFITVHRNSKALFSTIGIDTVVGTRPVENSCGWKDGALRILYVAITAWPADPGQRQNPVQPCYLLCRLSLVRGLT
jgi:hypothetical protein